MEGSERYRRERWDARIFCLTVDKAFFGLHTDCYLPGYGEGVDGVRRQHGGYPTFWVQHNSLTELG